MKVVRFENFICDLSLQMSQVLKRITETTDCTDSTDENLKKSVEFNNPKSVQSAKSVVPNGFYWSEASSR